MAFAQQSLGEVRTDESGHASYKNVLHLTKRQGRSNIHQHSTAVPIEFKIHVTQAGRLHRAPQFLAFAWLSAKDHESAAARAHYLATESTSLHRGVIISIDLRHRHSG